MFESRSPGVDCTVQGEGRGGEGRGGEGKYREKDIMNKRTDESM